MDAFPIDRPWEVVASGTDWRELCAHMFPGDGDEHAAVLLAGVHVRSDRVRLIIRDVFIAEDGVDHVAGTYGYRMVRAQFIQPLIRKARDERLVFLSVHNHAGKDAVAFSGDDLASHERGYPALLDVADGMPVGALVFAENAIAGDIWLPNGARVAIEQGVLLRGARQIIYPRPPQLEPQKAGEQFDRQVRLFGERGQSVLANTKVAIIGLGGAGSQLAELLGRLGVGHFVLIDFDRADITNLPRLIAARRGDVLLSEARATAWRLPPLVRALLRRRKIDMAARNIRRANCRAKIEKVFGSIADRSTAAHLLDADFLFLAADQMRARLAFNAIVHQYAIPGVQLGARVVADPETGEVLDVYAVSRPVMPDSGCLWCNGLIDPTKLQVEATEAAQAAVQNYGSESPAPSVATLNAIAAADAANFFQFFITGLAETDQPLTYRRYRALAGSMVCERPRANPDCPECGKTSISRRGRGGGAALPLKER